VRKVLLGAAMAAVVLVPGAATASSTASVKLALLPLPKSALGAVGRHLPLARDSGVVSNSDAASNASAHVTAKQLKRLGRVSGYLLDYGSPFGGSAGVHEIQTEIDRYRSAADASKGLAFWRRDEVKGPPKVPGIQFSVKKLQLSSLPKPSWSYAGSVSLKGLKPVRGIDAEIQHGPYLLDISIGAGSTAAAARLVPTIARHFYARVRLALAGRLHASLVAVPPALKPGPPPQGPKPSVLTLETADLGAGSKVLHKGYIRPKGSLDENALSVYDLTIASGGSFPILSQELIVGTSRLEMKYFAAVVLSAAVGSGSGSGKGVRATPVDVGSVGDNAKGELARADVNGQSVAEEAVVLTRGTYLDFLVEASPTAFTPADVRKLAGLAAKRLDAGFH
jgi:hypothetical protein